MTLHNKNLHICFPKINFAFDLLKFDSLFASWQNADRVAFFSKFSGSVIREVWLKLSERELCVHKFPKLPTATVMAH